MGIARSVGRKLLLEHLPLGGGSPEETIKKSLDVLGCVLALALFAGCAKTGGADAGANKNDPPPGTELHLEMLADNVGYLGTGAETGQGYYYATASEDMTHANIKFIDKQTREEIFLCSNPGCEHNVDSCTSYISLANSYSPELVCLKDKLVLFFPGMNAEQVQIKPHIDTLNLDGTDRKTCYTFNANQEYSDGVAGENSELYLLVSTYTEEGAKTELTEIDIQEGKSRVIAEVEPPCFFLGAYNNFVVLKTLGNSIFSEDFDPAAIPKGETAYSQQQHQIFAVDVTTGTTKSVSAWKQDVCVEFMAGEKLFLTTQQGRQLQLTVQDLAAQEEKTFVIDKEAEDLSRVSPLLYHNGCFIFELIEGYQESGALLVHQYAYDLQNNALTQIELYDPVRGYPLTIEGTLGEDIILRNILYSGKDESSCLGQELVVYPWQDYLASRWNGQGQG